MQIHLKKEKSGGRGQRIVILPLAVMTALLWGAALLGAGLGTWRGAEVELLPYSPAAAPYQLDLNDAGIDELVCLPGIGPTLAERILERREELGGLHTAGDLLSVSGIGPATYEGLQPYILPLEEP